MRLRKLHASSLNQPHSSTSTAPPQHRKSGEGHGGAELVIKIGAIGNNTKMTSEINAGSAIEMGDSSAAKLFFSDCSNSTHDRSMPRLNL